ncbi:hypothetical protein L1887_29020 [Cichorium endivia]|nr:hypothetical protein L1887_29020 [Cichorium endivia]
MAIRASLCVASCRQSSALSPKTFFSSQSCPTNPILFSTPPQTTPFYNDQRCQNLLKEQLNKYPSRSKKESQKKSYINYGL